MNKNILFIFVALLYSAGILAQVPYYGTPFYKEGFDAETMPSGWVQTGTTGGAATTSAWSTTNSFSPSGKNFNNIDPSSTYTLLATIASGKGLVSTLTSDVISNTKSNLCFGFTIYNPTTTFTTGYFACLLSNDNGVKWDTVWRSDKTPKYEYKLLKAGSFMGWFTFQTNLPTEFNKKNIQVRFEINSPDVKTSETQLYIDGVFLSERRSTDATLLAIEGFDPSPKTNERAYFQRPLTVRFKNEGVNPISSIGFGYKKGKSPAVLESKTLATPLNPGDSTTYTFNAKADFALDSKDTIYLWTDLTGDEYRKNDSLPIIVTNTLIGTPYSPKWLVVPGIPYDYWEFIEPYDNSGNTHPRWSGGTYKKRYAMYLDPSKKFLEGDSHLFSRPLYLKAGKTYDLKFTTTTESQTKLNGMEVYMTTRFDTTARVGNSLLKVYDVNDSKYIGKTFRVSITKDTSYYFVFHAMCAPENPAIYLYDVSVKEVTDVDAAVVGLVAPVDHQLTYTANEKIKIKVANSGKTAIAANKLKIYYQVDDAAKVTETVPAGLAVQEEATYEFSGSVDLSALKTRNIKIGVVLDGDQTADNNEIIVPITPAVTELPYIPNFGTVLTSPTYEEEFWNYDPAIWKISYTTTEGRFSYGGVANAPETKVGKIYTRPVRFPKDQASKISYSIMIGTVSLEVPMVVGMYKKSGNDFVLVSKLSDAKVVTTVRNAYTTYEADFKATEAGDYYLGFTVTPPDNAMRTSLYLKDVKLSKGGSDIKGIDVSGMPVIYPNPASEYISFKGDFAGNVAIYSISGQKVLDKSILPNENINVSSFAKGIYIIEMAKGSELIRQKLIIK